MVPLPQNARRNQLGWTLDSESAVRHSGRMAKAQPQSVIPIERIAAQIYLMRGQKVMLDTDLATLYGVETRVLNQAVTRNDERFPDDFMFRLSWDEYESLRSQNVMLEGGGRGQHRKFTPRAFTQEGVAMLAGVLRSPKAVETSISIVRAFVRLRASKVTAREPILNQKRSQHWPSKRRGRRCGSQSRGNPCTPC